MTKQYTLPGGLDLFEDEEKQDQSYSINKIRRLQNKKFVVNSAKGAKWFFEWTGKSGEKFIELLEDQIIDRFNLDDSSDDDK